MYALVSDASIGYLFLGGVVPGLLMALAQMLIVGVTARRKRFPVEPPTPLRELPGITWRALPTLTMPVVLLGGIYSGIRSAGSARIVTLGSSRSGVGGSTGKFLRRASKATSAI
jgi:TRAP-type C4-dicarboxylate transport system permease large subunit